MAIQIVDRTKASQKSANDKENEFEVVAVACTSESKKEAD